MVFPESLPSHSVGIHQTPFDYPDEIRAGEAEKLPGGVLYDSTLTREVRIGEILAIHGTTGRAWPRKSTELAAEATSTATALFVDDAHMFIVGDTLVVQDSTGGGVITAIDYVTGEITVTALSGGTDPHPVNSRVFVNSNALGTARYIAAERYTPNTNFAVLGQGSVYIAGLFHKGKLKGSAAGVDTQANTDLGGVTIARLNDPDGDLYRIG